MLLPIVTLTVNPALDVTVPVDKVESGPKLRCGPPRLDPGGGGINASRVLHRLGVPTIALYAIGGLTGGRLRALIDQEGFTHRPIAVAGETRQSFTAHEGHTGLQYRFVLPGPELSANEWQGLLETTIELAEKADLVVASGSLPPGVPDDFYARLADVLDARGVRLILDSSGPGLATTLARAHVYLVKPNIHEIVELAGDDLAWPEGQADWASGLIVQGSSDIVLVTHGADGALVVTADRRVRIKPPVLQVQSAVGAGDSFTGGLCAGLVRGESVIEASALGMAAAAATLLTPGTELCHPQDVERLRVEIEILDL
jgi:6-phosphofructokinase 2